MFSIFPKPESFEVIPGFVFSEARKRKKRIRLNKNALTFSNNSSKICFVHNIASQPDYRLKLYFCCNEIEHGEDKKTKTRGVIKYFSEAAGTRKQLTGTARQNPAINFGETSP